MVVVSHLFLFLWKSFKGKALFYIVKFFVDPKNGTLENK